VTVAPTNSAGRFAHLDAMRAIAVLLVVVNHAGVSWVPGQSGVTIFFAISGFIITYVVLSEHEKTQSFRADRFYTNRIVKLLPPFAVLILVPTCLYALFNPVNWYAVGAQVFFIFNWVQIYLPEAASDVLPGSGVTWSLGVEEQFYIAFALLWILLAAVPQRRRVLAFSACLAIVLSTALRFAITPQVDDMFFVRSTLTRLDSIAWGVLAALAYTSWRAGRLPRLRLLRSDAVALCAAGLFGVSFFVPEPLAFTCQSISACVVIIWGLLPGEGALRSVIFAVSTWRPVETIGLASYSIYLAHAPLFFWLVPLSGLDLPAPASITLLVVLGVCAGVLAWRAIEVPALQWRRAHIDRLFVSQ